MDSKGRKNRIEEIEKLMAGANFWSVKNEAQKIIQEYTDLKEESEKGVKSYPAIITIIAGAGGNDSEDFVRILAVMYKKYAEGKRFSVFEIDKHSTQQGGYKNISLEIDDKRAYGLLKNETGVHRLVRVSPFNANNQRHTSFALVDVTPKLPPVSEIEIPETDLEIDFTNSGGPGGQNVNKRETAVRIKHIPSGITVRVEKERSQAHNREAALEIIRGKLFALMKDRRVEQLRDMSFDRETGIEWGNQIRSYVLHPYKMVKDYRVDYEERNPDEVFDGNLDGFINALKEYQG